MIYTLTINPAIDMTFLTHVINKDRTNKTELRSISIGGKGFNTSRALKCLDIDSTAVAFYGGPLSVNIKKMLDDDNISSRLIPIKGTTRVNVKVIEEKSNNLVEFNEKGPIMSQDELDSLFTALKEVSSKADFFVISGSLPYSVDVEIYKEIITILKNEKTITLLDVSGLPLYYGISALPEIVKVNREEISEVCSRYYRAETETVIRDLIKKGIRMVMITDGPRDTFYYDSSGKYRIKSPDITGQYKTGAGDAVKAGLIFALQRDYGIKERLRFAVACGNANILTETPGEIEIKTVNEIVPRRIVEKEKD